MSALDDFIAQDPVSRDFVKLDGNIQWTELQVRDRTEAILEGSGYTQSDQRILARKIDLWELEKIEEIRQHLGLTPDPILQPPPYPLSDAEKTELAAYGQASLLCGALKDVMWARAQLVSDAISYESWRAFLDSLGPVPDLPEVDPNADVRAQLQTIMAGFSQGTKDLVAQRDAWRNPPEQPA
jgi:hypothetical protein